MKFSILPLLIFLATAILATALKAETNSISSDLSRSLSGEWRSSCFPSYVYNDADDSYEVFGYVDQVTTFYDNNMTLIYWSAFPAQNVECKGHPNMLQWSLWEIKELGLSKNSSKVYTLRSELVNGYHRSPRKSVGNFMFLNDSQKVIKIYYDAGHDGNSPPHVVSVVSEWVGPSMMTLEERLSTLERYCSPSLGFSDCDVIYERPTPLSSASSK